MHFLIWNEITEKVNYLQNALPDVKRTYRKVELISKAAD